MSAPSKPTRSTRKSESKTKPRTPGVDTSAPAKRGKKKSATTESTAAATQDTGTEAKPTATAATVAQAPSYTSFRQFLLKAAQVRAPAVPSSAQSPDAHAAAGTTVSYTFAGRPALSEIVNLIDHVLGSTSGQPLKDTRLALAGGAQFGKTTLELNLAAYVAGCRFLNPIVFLPDDKLADEIVDAKFRPDILDQIPWLAEMTRVGRSVNQSGKAVNTKGAFLVTDGKRKAVGMFRGLQKPPTTFTADIVIEDEKDDIHRANSKFISGRMTASALRFHLEVGTQRIHGAGQNLVWKNGSQGVVLLASARAWSAYEQTLSAELSPASPAPHGHRHVTFVPSGFINPEEAWPQICRCAVTGTRRRDDPVLGFEADFRRPGSPEVIATFEPAGHYYAHPETGEELECHRPLWHHRAPAKLEQRQFSFRVAQIGTLAIDLTQIVAHWTRAVGPRGSKSFYVATAGTSCIDSVADAGIVAAYYHQECGRQHPQTRAC